MLSEIAEIWSAVLSDDAWMISESLKSNAAWLVGAFATVFGGILFLVIYHFVPWFERKFEATVMVSTYLLIGAIIFVEVFRRFVLNVQAPWSTTLPPFLFLIMTWAGCAYNVKLRTHLAFAEFRKAAPRPVQLFLLLLDGVLWLGFAWIVVVTTTQESVRAAANFSIMLGTDNVLQWWFLVTVPIAFILLSARVMVNLLADLRKFRNGDEMIEAAVIGGDA